ncbi:MAG: hypothetical protein ACI358_09815 [Candidatus Limimorpha sp.]
MGKRKLLLLLLMFVLSFTSYCQDDDFKKYLESSKKKLEQKSDEQRRFYDSRNEKYSDYVEKRNAEFAEFVAKRWELYNEFYQERIEMAAPKPKTAPMAETSYNNDVVKSSDIAYRDDVSLPTVTHLKMVAYGDTQGVGSNYVIKNRVEDNGMVTSITANAGSSKKYGTNLSSDIMINFYGCMIPFSVNQKLRIKSTNAEEKSVADYFTRIAKCQEETHDLWLQVSAVVKMLGLNEWGSFCLLRDISEQMFEKYDDRVLFCFYMLRNEGEYKARLARGSESGRLVLLIALDNKKEVYSYSFFRFADDDNGKMVKYYTVYGGGNPNEAVYSYDFCVQDSDKRQMGLDFDGVLNMGECDKERELRLTADKVVRIPYNSAHIAYLNDVPMTVFPLYFSSPISIEAQKVLQDSFNELKSQYSCSQFIGILLNFVQTAFDYKTDEEQFGYEKYFYPEEVIGYPYSDCEDRSALFAWLVTKYTDAKVIGLQYEGHVATAVCFGDNADVSGDGFVYGGNKYYVCDPTYINAPIGLSMPQFKGVTPKVIKIRR